MSEFDKQQQRLSHLKRSIADIEAAVQNREHEVQLAFSKTCEQNLEGVHRLVNLYINKSETIEKEVISLSLNYLFRVSFISAFYRVVGNKKEMLEAVTAATILVEKAGFPPGDAMNLILIFEKDHAKILRSELPGRMIRHGRVKLIGVVVVVTLVLVTAWLLFS